jgi:hypothetical protein
VTNFQATKLDRAKLEQLSEEDVIGWLVTRMDQMREAGTPVHSLGVYASYRNYRPEPYYDTSWSVHAGGECDSGGTSEQALEDLKRKLAKPNLAKAKREKAKELLEEAEAIEQATGAAGRKEKVAA